MYTPVNPSFTIQKWGVKGYTLHGHVSMMVFFVLSAHLFFFTLIIRDVFCNRGDSMTSYRVIMRTEQITKCSVPL